MNISDSSKHLLRLNLISYRDLLAFLKERGKGRNWFNPLRTRHKLIHPPIVLPVQMQTLKEVTAKKRQGRLIFYLREITDYLDEIIRLHDDEGFSYNEIVGKVQDKCQKLKRLRALQLIDNKLLKPIDFIVDFEIARRILSKYFNSTQDAKESVVFENISQMRAELGARYYALTQEEKDSVRSGGALKDSEISRERGIVAEKLALCHVVMESVIRHCRELIRSKQISINSLEIEAMREEVYTAMG